MRASTPLFSKKRRVRSGYSVETRTPAGRSCTPWNGEASGTANTTWIGRDVALEYCSWPRETTSLDVSSIQSRPVIPRSNVPSAT